ncbi:MAG: penicillin-binding protein [Frankiales bacterium]|nr:penicillin-binding protein [Frankiales bacterium]
MRARRRRRGVIAWLVAAVLAFASSFTGGLLTAPIDFAAPPPIRTAVLLADDGTRVLASLRPPLDQEIVTGKDIPAVMRTAIVAAEDRTFFTHRGVDPLAVVRAAYKDITGGRRQGGSTITQQYVKNVYVGRQRTLLRKVKEAALAVRLENRLSKDEILTGYLNNVYLGNATYGIQAATKYYFGVPVKDLDLDTVNKRRSPALALSRASLLAGIVPAPSFWNPVVAPKVARAKQLDVLNRMIEDGVITSGQASAAYGATLPKILRVSRPDAPTIAPEFRDIVARSIRKKLGAEAIDKQGVRIRTTLDYDLQQAAVQAVQSVLSDPADPEAAVIALDPRTGDIKAMTTRVVTDKSRTYTRDGFNLATQSARQSGSTIKPFTLATAIEQGISPDERVRAPRVAYIKNPGGTPNPYPVHNADVSESGTFTLRRAMWDSINTVYAPLAIRVGLAKVMAMAGASGFGPRQYLSSCCPANSLGVNVTPLALVQAYSTLANHGVRLDPRTVTEVNASNDDGSAGSSLLKVDAHPKGVRAMKDSTADQVVDVLYGVVDHGTARRAVHQPEPVFGKTGTTNDFTNAWFVGCTPKLCVGVWMGYDKERVCPHEGKTCANAKKVAHSMNHVQGQRHVFGGTLPAEIFQQTLTSYRQLKAAAAAGKPRPLVTPTPKRTTRPRTRHTPIASLTPGVTTAPRPTTTSAPRPTTTSSPPRPPVPTILPSSGGP